MILVTENIFGHCINHRIQAAMFATKASECVFPPKCPGVLVILWEGVWGGVAAQCYRMSYADTLLRHSRY